MLQSLHVKNLALIDEIEVEFDKGLNILTGETGAGKSIILGSVNLALGGKYTKDILREGTAYGFVELSFLIQGERQKEILDREGIILEDDVLTLSRRVMPGRSVCRINGETVPVSKIKEIAGILIDIHGQHEHQSLLYKKNHLQILDEYANDIIHNEKEEMRKSYLEYKSCLKELTEAMGDESERMKELSFLQYEVNEIEKANLVPGEDEELEALYKRMTNGRRIVDASGEAYGCTGGNAGSASDQISRAVRALSDIRDLDEKASELYGQLIEVDDLLNDFNRELSAFSDSFEYSEEDLIETEQRLDLINHLKVKYGHQFSDIFAYADKQRKRIEILNDYDNYLSNLKKRTSTAEKKMLTAAQKLSKIRKQEAARFQDQIIQGLKDLNFEAVNFEIHFENMEKPASSGIDDVEFMVSLNQGQPLRPLANVASGGELSRIMLVIKTVMADKDNIETLIFDEIDVGISGRTAQKVSEKMGMLGRNHQVICITHLAQIASMADTHFLIEKKSAEGITKTNIRKLDETDAVREVARILGGAQITKLVLDNAYEMKQLADQLKNRS